jgi:hypothetical protein
MSRITAGEARVGLGRELGQSILLLGLTGSSVGVILAMATLATRALGGG